MPKPATKIVAETLGTLLCQREDHAKWAAQAKADSSGWTEAEQDHEYRFHFGYLTSVINTLRMLGQASDSPHELINAEVARIRILQNTTRERKLTLGDRVIDFRGEKTGEVVSVEANRGPGKSDRVVVLVDNGGGQYRNYETVWSKV